MEKKYRVNRRQRQKIERALESAGMALDAYGRTRVTSLYLDTPFHEVIGRSIERPLYKEKLRLRAYGDVAGHALLSAFVPGKELDISLGRTTVFFELKKKFDGIVYKRRVGMSIAAAVEWLRGTPYERACDDFPPVDDGLASESLGARGIQIAREIESARRRWGGAGVKPCMAISCEREAWTSDTGSTLASRRSDTGSPCGSGPLAGMPDGFNELRVTFDDQLAWWQIPPATGDHVREERTGRIRHTDLDETSSEEGRWSMAWNGLLGSDEGIMEIKCAGSYPLWLVAALDGAGAYPGSFSKYGAAYADMELRDGDTSGSKSDHIPSHKANARIRGLYA